MKKSKRITSLILSMLLTLSCISQVTFGLTLVPVEDKSNTYAMVGLAYWDIWRNSSGQWQGGAPDSTQNLALTYNVTGNGKKIKSISVRNYTASTFDQQLWSKSRSDYKPDKYNSAAQQISVSKSSQTGIGSTDGTVSVNLKVKLTCYDAEELPNPPGAAANVLGLRYYVPLIIEIEVEEEVREVIVQHFNVDGTKLGEDAPIKKKVGESFTASAKTFPNLDYQNYKYSINGGKTFSGYKEGSNVSLKITGDTYIRFYYGAKGELRTTLEMSANPNSIESGKTADVKFTLDASKTVSKNPIKSYEFFFGPSEDSMKSQGSSTKNSIIVNQSKVNPNTTWYGKVIVTDTKGNTAESSTSVDIESEDAVEDSSPPKEVNARMGAIKFSSPGSIPNPSDITFNLAELVKDIKLSGSTTDYNYDDELTVVLKRDERLMKALEDYDNADYMFMYFDMTVDGSKSWSTYGIGEYKILLNGGGWLPADGEGSSSSSSVTIDEINGEQLGAQGLFWSLVNGEDPNMRFKLQISDKKYPEYTDETGWVSLMFELEEEPLTPPTVKLEIDATEFIIGESAGFTVEYKEFNQPIVDKQWFIESKTSDLVLTGAGDIPSSYELFVPAGNYVARQEVYYMEDGSKSTASDEVEFKVIPLRNPAVFLRCDKEVYQAPTDVLFTATFTESYKYLPIDSREWKIENSSGELIDSGDGVIPSKYLFDEYVKTDTYKATQTIYWVSYGEPLQMSASVTFRVVSPTPVARFEVSQRMHGGVDFKRIDLGDLDGTEFREINIDLSSSIQATLDAENTIPLQLTNSQTQIQITPLNADGTSELSKVTEVKVPTSYNKKLDEDGRLLIYGTGKASIRFDDYGRYRIRVKVSNGKYVSDWVVKDIYIKEDLPLDITMDFTDVSIESGENKVYRESDDLHARFGLNVSVSSPDEDSSLLSTAKLKISYDYNADDNVDNDGAHSTMSMTNTYKSIQSYLDVVSNDTLDSFTIDMGSTAFSILGKLKFDYVVDQEPYNPYFTGQGLPALPDMSSNTYSLPDINRFVTIDNKGGVLTVSTGKKEKVEVTLIKGIDTVNINLNDLVNYFGDEVKIYIIDKDGNRTLYH